VRHRRLQQEAVVERWQPAEDIAFQRNSPEIRPKCAAKIARLAAWLKEHPLVMVALDPHGRSALEGHR
jgi:hypothetical protein